MKSRLIALFILCVSALHADLATQKLSFPQSLLKEVYSSEKNIALSPYSIMAALAMTGAGARGDTATQVAHVLQLGDTHESIVEQFAAIQKTVDEAVSEDVALQIANALFPQKGYNFLPEYLDLIKARFNSGLFPVDYAGETEKSRHFINAWISERTKERIPELLTPGTLTPLTRLVLVNAIYFKGAWKERFDEEKTSLRPFTFTNGKTKNVPFMNRTGNFKYLETETAQILDIPYKGEKLVLTLFLPKAGHSMEAAVASLSKTNLTQFKLGDVAVSFPKFTFKANFNLPKNLMNLGMTDAFNGKANFSGMNGNRELYISDVVHEAFIEVNEVGTEAAAATAVLVAARGIFVEPEPIRFLADRPFAFAIRVVGSDTILFLGVVNDPS